MVFRRKAKRVISLAASAALVLSSLFAQDISGQAEEVAGIPYNSFSTGSHGTGVTWTYYKAAEETANTESFLILEGNGQGSSTAAVDAEDENYSGNYHYKDQYEKQGWYQDCRTNALPDENFTKSSGGYENLPEIFISNVHTVSSCSFYNQKKITKIWVSENVKELSEFCFSRTSGATDIYIYGELEKFDVSALYRTGLSTNIHVASEATKTLIENAINSGNQYASRGTVVQDLSVDDTPLRIAIKKAAIITNTHPEGSGYTEKSWTALTAAVTEGQNAFAQIAAADGDEAKKAIVTEKTKDINDAMDGLVSCEALDAAMEAAGKLVESDYTADSWKTLRDALGAAQKALETELSQEKVNELVSDLNTAMEGLQPVTAESAKEELNAVLAKAGKMVESDYSEATWSAFAAALEKAEAVSGSETASTITNAAAELRDAMDALSVEYPFEWIALAGIPTGNKSTSVLSIDADSEMDGAVRMEFVFDCMPNTGFNQWCAISVKYRIGGEPFEGKCPGESKYNDQTGLKDVTVSLNLEKPVAAGKTLAVTAASENWSSVKGDIYRIKAVNFYDASDTLLKSIEAPGVKGMLDAALAAAEEKLDSLHAEDYTQEGMEAAAGLIASAKETGEEDILPSQVEALNQIADGSSALLAPRDTTAIKGELDSVLAEAAAYQEGDYTAESWQALKEAVEAAGTVADNAMYSEIEALKQAVADAIQALVPSAPEDTGKPDDTSAPGGTEKPDDTSAPGSTEKPDDTSVPDSTGKPDGTPAPGGTTPVPGTTAAPGGTGGGTTATNPPAADKKPGKAAVRKVAAKKSTVTVTLKKAIAGATGYQVVAAGNKKFKKAASVTVKAGKKLTLSVKYKKLKVKKGKTFYLKVRAVRKSDGKNVYGSYSAVKKFTAK